MENNNQGFSIDDIDNKSVRKLYNKAKLDKEKCVISMLKAIRILLGASRKVAAIGIGGKIKHIKFIEKHIAKSPKEVSRLKDLIWFYEHSISYLNITGDPERLLLMCLDILRNQLQIIGIVIN